MFAKHISMPDKRPAMSGEEEEKRGKREDVKLVSFRWWEQRCSSFGEDASH